MVEWVGGGGGGLRVGGVTSHANPNPYPSSSPAANPSPSPSPNRNPNLDELRCAGKGASYRTPLDPGGIAARRGTWL